MDVVVTMDHIYLSMYMGERVKINRTDLSIVWAVSYGNNAYSLAISSDKTFLIAGADLSYNHLSKLSALDGSVLASYTIGSTGYTSIIVSDS